MDHTMTTTEDTGFVFPQWQLGDGLEYKRQELKEERRQFEEERKQFEQEKKSFFMQKDIEDRKLETERKLFEMKWKLLEEEVRKLASEKAQMEKQRNFYKYVSSFSEEAADAKKNVVSGDMFFVGVVNEQSLKKRYKELIKIYHPDNLDGDTGTIQEINREYDRLKQKYE